MRRLFGVDDIEERHSRGGFGGEKKKKKRFRIDFAHRERERERRKRRKKKRTRTNEKRIVIIIMRPSHLMKRGGGGGGALNFDALTMMRSKQRANLALGVALFVVFVFVARSFVVDSVFEDRNESSFSSSEDEANGSVSSAARELEKQTMRHDRRVEDGIVWFRTHSGGGNRCALDAKGACGKHGTCVKNVCVCAVLYGGKSCDRHIDVPEVYYPSAEESDDKEKMMRLLSPAQKEAREKSAQASGGGKVDDLTEGIAFEGAMTLNKETCGKVGTARVSALTVKMASKRSDDASASGLIGGFFGNKDRKSGAPGKGFVNVGTVEQTVLNRLAETDVVTPKEEPWTSCAVVGKSGVLLSYENGPNIDQHQAVIRVDDLPTRGFEQSVGSRTTVRICGDAKLPFCQKYVREGAEETLIANITNGNSLRAFARMHRLHDNSVGAVTKKRLKLEAFHPEFMEFVAEAIEGISPMTTEAQAVMFALLNCASVDIYGIGLGPSQGFATRYDNDLGNIGNAGTLVSSNGITSELDQVEGSFNLLKTLYNYGLAHVAERCIVECHSSADACVLCQTELLHAVEDDF